MNAAEFKTAHEALGVSGEFLAARVGVHVQRVWAYETPTRSTPIPDYAAEAIRDMLNDFEVAADRLATAAEAPESEGLARYIDLDDFYAAVPEMNGWGSLSQGLLLAEVARRVPGTPIEYV